jgi:hypothetical protein
MALKKRTKDKLLQFLKLRKYSLKVHWGQQDHEDLIWVDISGPSVLVRPEQRPHLAAVWPASPPGLRSGKEHSRLAAKTPTSFMPCAAAVGDAVPLVSTETSVQERTGVGSRGWTDAERAETADGWGRCAPRATCRALGLKFKLILSFFLPSFLSLSLSVSLFLAIKLGRE